ncbi:MAG: response regulator transcription factor [Bacteroidota bacterium]
MRNKPLKIIVIDADVAYQQCYGQFLKSVFKYSLTDCYNSFHQVLSNYDSINPDIIVSEVFLQGSSGIDGTELIRMRDNSVKIIISSSQSDVGIIKEAFKKGANGFLTKPITKERFLNALDSLSIYGAAMSYDVTQKIIASFQKKYYKSFSKRENQIIDFLTQGATYKVIADKLFVTPSTINFHIQNIYLKLNVNSKSEALKKLKELEVQELN